jgi:DNA-binding response OmpR family regulator
MAVARRPTALVVEDDDSIRLLLLEILAAEGFAVAAQRDLKSAREHVAKAGMPDVAILDYFLPDGVITALAAELRAQRVPCVVVSAYERSLEEAMHSQVDVWLAKPFELSEILVVIRQLLSPTVNTVLGTSTKATPA